MEDIAPHRVRTYSSALTQTLFTTPRIIDVAERVCSVLLAILIAWVFGGANISWAAFAGYMVLSGAVSNTLLRGAFRFVGTLAGGLLALTLSPWITPHLAITSGALFVVATLSLYAATTSRRAYAWLFFGLTFVAAVLDHLSNPQVRLRDFVETRVLETVAGIVACILVSLLWTVAFRKDWRTTTEAAKLSGGWHPDAFRHALQGASAVTLLAIASAVLHVPGPSQAAVTIMAVMLIPVEAMARSGLMPVSTRLLHRLIGCTLGGLYAAVCLFLFQGEAPLLLAATAIGVAIARLIETGSTRWPYVGTQFVLAMLVTLVPDDYTHVASTPAWERLAGIFVGMAFLLPVLLIWHILAPRTEPPGQPTPDTRTTDPTE